VDAGPIGLSSMAFTIELLNVGDEDRAKRWETYVQGQRQASGYHSLGWKVVLERVYGYRTYYLYARDGRDVVGILPLALVGTRVTGRALVSLPFTSYGGIVSDDADVVAGLFEAGAELSRRLGLSYVELRHFERTPIAAPTKTHKVTMWLDLPPSVDTLWKAFPTALRTDIRKRIKDGLEVRIGGAEELENFYRVYSTNMRDLGTPVYPKAFFTTILAEWPGSAWIATCRHQGEAVASGFLLGFRGTLEIPWASSLKTRKSLRPNMLLHWECLRHAIDSGFTRFDFGRSPLSGGTQTFKSQWGARAVPLYWQYWLARGTEIPDVNRENPRFTPAIRIWQRLPLWLTRLVGPRLARHFP
jgi:FemAB-related protein (PEP-CTERM system-associated)